jgi:hypothetical protein
MLSNRSIVPRALFLIRLFPEKGDEAARVLFLELSPETELLSLHNSRTKVKHQPITYIGIGTSDGGTSLDPRSNQQLSNGLAK